MKSKIIAVVPSTTLNCFLSGGVSPSPDDGISRNRQEKRGVISDVQGQKWDSHPVCQPQGHDV